MDCPDCESAVAEAPASSVAAHAHAGHAGTGHAGAWLSGFIGMLIFSGSLPATRVGVLGFDPIFLTLARAAFAGLLAGAVLLVTRQKLPEKREIVPLIVVALGVVFGFPLLTGIALQHSTSAHSLVFIGLMPMATALFAVLRAHERPRPAFWLFSALGSACVVGYALSESAAGTLVGDLLMVAAITVCGLGYAEGGRMSRHLGGWQVVCWALVISLPVAAPLALLAQPATYAGIPASAWIGLAYVSIFSMFVGFIFWYRGLAGGGIAAVGQLQLLQPFFGMGLAALLLHESVSPAMLAAAAGVVLFVALARRNAA